MQAKMTIVSRVAELMPVSRQYGIIVTGDQ